jgi:hypothetical protein
MLTSGADVAGREITCDGPGLYLVHEDLGLALSIITRLRLD